MFLEFLNEAEGESPKDEKVKEPTDADVGVKADSDPTADEPPSDDEDMADEDDPTDDEAPGDSDDPTGDGPPDDEESEGEDDDMEDDGSDGEDAEDPQPSGSDDKTKKYRLMQDYSGLRDIAQELKEGLARINISDFSDREKVMYESLSQTVHDSLEKLEFVMTQKFQAFDYVKLMTIFNYLKATVMAVSDILKKLIRA